MEIRRKVCTNGQAGAEEIKRKVCANGQVWGRKRPKKNAGNRRYRETIRSVFGFSRGGEDFIAFLFQGGLAEVGFFGKIFAEFGTDVFDFFFEGAEFGIWIGRIRRLLFISDI